jgi:excisionase family DNA binding protein
MRDLTVDDISAELGLHAGTVRRLINQGVIPAYRAGLKSWRVQREALDAFKASGGPRRVGRPKMQNKETN